MATNTTPNVGDNVVIDEETVPDGWARYGEIAETDGQSYVIALEDGNTCEILPDQFRVVGDGEEPPATGFANGDRIILSGRHVDDEDTAHTGTVDGIRPDGRLVLRMNDHRTVMVWPADAVKDATTARNPA